MIETIAPSSSFVSDILHPRVQIRSAYMQEHNNSTAAVGGYFDVKSDRFYGAGLHMRFVHSQKLFAYHSTDAHYSNYLLSPDAKSYTLLNLANINYKSDTFKAKIGRIEVTTPFADPDDFRFIANSFSGLSVEYTPSQEMMFRYIDIHNSSGIDAFKTNTFSPLFMGAKSMKSLAATVHINAFDSLSLWNFYVDNMTHALYANIDTKRALINGQLFHASVGYMHQEELSNSNVAGDVVSILLQTSYQGWYATAGYDSLYTFDNNYVTDGFGAGPFAVAMDLTSLGVASTMYAGYNIQAGRILVGKSLRGVSVEVALGYFDVDGVVRDVYEHNVIVKWFLNSSWQLHTVATVGQHRTRPMHFAFVRLEYMFNDQK